MSLPKLNLESLSAAERLALIGRIWDTTDDVGLSPAQHEELVRRLEDMEQHPEDAVTWDEAQRRTRESKR